MTCRHSPGDPNCTSAKYNSDYSPPKPDKANYKIEDVHRVGPHLVLKVRYPNCSMCAYEGHKIMVFLNVTELAALKWQEIDPHFRDPKKSTTARQAPSPAARFPASPEGWADAVAYATGKVK